jgi:hypothetical protein
VYLEGKAPLNFEPSCLHRGARQDVIGRNRNINVKRRARFSVMHLQRESANQCILHIIEENAQEHKFWFLALVHGLIARKPTVYETIASVKFKADFEARLHCRSKRSMNRFLAWTCSIETTRAQPGRRGLGGVHCGMAYREFTRKLI